MTQWQYNINGATLRGVGVVGAVVIDAGVGYIYAPLIEEFPIIWRFPRPVSQNQHGSILEAFQGKVDEFARKAGGGIEVSFAPPTKTSPSESELAEVKAHAANAKYLTRIDLDAESVWVFTEFGTESRGIRVDFQSLLPDPVQVLKTTIDRMNADLQRQIGIR